MKKIREELQQFGLAATHPRSVILRCLRERKDHPDAETVYQTVHQEIPSLSIDTVYRTLNLFASSGLIVHLAMPTHRFRFDGGVEPHDHFLCTTCEQIVDIEPEENDHQVFSEKVAALGQILSLQRVYLGTCHACKKAI
ncbi:MAG: Fur family transcriptional regulator [Kiritimatiellae bacterium]|nr:Fur family transcriptional regulator [Kiritimatiellia bacterium]